MPQHCELKMIRTVLGDIKKEEFGNVLIHEHIRCVSNDMLMSQGAVWLDENNLEDYAVRVLSALKLCPLFFVYNLWFFVSMLLIAGLFITLPSAVNLEPWQLQSHECSCLLYFSAHPKCVHRGVIGFNNPRIDSPEFINNCL